jgi:hypothetical protein
MPSIEDRLVALAIGRILRMGSRPEQPGDAEEYQRCKRIILDQLCPHGLPIDTRPSYARDYGKGAQGDW